MTEQQSIWRNTNVPPLYRGTYDKAMAGKPMAAIKAKCQECTNWQREEIKQCTIEYCPLWPLRRGRKFRLAAQGGQKPRKPPDSSGLAKYRAQKAIEAKVGTVTPPEGDLFDSM